MYDSRASGLYPAPLSNRSVSDVGKMPGISSISNEKLAWF